VWFGTYPPRKYIDVSKRHNTTNMGDTAQAMPAFSDGTNDAPLFALEDTTGPQPLLFGAANLSNANNNTNNNAPAPTTGTNGGQPTFNFTTLAPQPQQHKGGSGSSQQPALLSASPVGSTGSPANGSLQPGGTHMMSTSGPGSAASGHHAVSLSTPDAQNRNVYVASLPNSFTDDNLRELFTPFGPIVSCKMFNNDGRPGSHGRAYGFVMFAEEASVQRAIDALVGAVVGSQRIQVRRAKQNVRGPSQPGSTNPTPMSSATQPALLPNGATSPPGVHHSPPQQQPPQQQSVMMIQPGGSVTLQHIGSNALGQPIFLTPAGQQVVLAAPSAPLSQTVQPAQPQAYSSGSQPQLLPMGSGTRQVLMPTGGPGQQAPPAHGNFVFQQQHSQ